MGRVAGRLISRRSCGFVLRGGEKPIILVVCALDPMQVPTCANTYIFAVQYQRRVNPVSVAVAPGTLLAAVTLPVVVWVVAR
jgi:predicted permease